MKKRKILGKKLKFSGKIKITYRDSGINITYQNYGYITGNNSMHNKLHLEIVLNASGGQWSQADHADCLSCIRLRLHHENVVRLTCLIGGNLCGNKTRHHALNKIAFHAWNMDLLSKAIIGIGIVSTINYADNATFQLKIMIYREI